MSLAVFVKTVCYDCGHVQEEKQLNMNHFKRRTQWKKETERTLQSMVSHTCDLCYPKKGKET